ncbi:MAG TPA: HAMP domain-containing sensor histidine kinase [Kineosporiaceae bacterium]|nr:HAMP domain-containing sensor histidine kinase [Kineosporiaceae bacterium]
MRRRIVLVSGATTVLVLVAYLVPLLVLVRQIAQTRAMAAATASAQTVVTVLLTVAGRDEARIGVDSVNAAGPLRTTVFYPDGTQLGAPAAANADVQLAKTQRLSFDTAAVDGRAVYLAVDLGDARCCVVVRTFVPEAQLQAGVVPASLVLTGLAVALLLTALLVAQLLARSLVRPLLQVAAVAHGLHDGDLSRRAGLSGPAEISSIAATLNRLATRIDTLLQAERETVADLSHRVRTPLTALRLNVESLNDPEDAERLAADLDEVERSLNHVIEQARLPARQPAPSSSDLIAVTRARLDFWSVLANEQARAMTAALPVSPVVVPVPADRLQAAVDALVGNVFAHTPPGTPFSVSVTPGPPTQLIVEDLGPGLAEQTLIERGRSASGSTGLGLDIARRTGESSGGGLDVATGISGRGLRATVTFGPASPSPPAAHR